MTDPDVEKDPDIEKDFAAWTAGRWAQIVPDANSTAASVAIRLRVVSESLTLAQMEALRPWRDDGIKSMDDFRTLALICHVDPPGIFTYDIARHLGVGAGTISSRVDRLEQHGFIVRVPNPADRRTHHLQIHPDRVSDITAMYRALVADHESFFGQLSSEQHNALSELLGLI